MKEKQQYNFLKYFSILFFIILSYFNGLILISPSDPLQYVLPVYDLDSKFYFIDRYTLFLFLKILSFFISDPLYISSFFSTICWVLIFNFSFEIVYILSKKVKSLYLFSITFLYSPFFLTLSQIIYPTILYLLILVLIFYCFLKSNNSNYYSILIYMLLPFFIFSKIQSICILPIIIYALIRKNIFKANYILVFTIVLFFIIFNLVFVDNLLFVSKDSTLNYLQDQYIGRNTKILPPFYAYFFEPSSLLVIMSILYIIYFKLSKYYYLTYFIIYLFASIFLIYVITKRGGPLIYNYNLDFFLFGLILFSITFAEYLSLYILKLIFASSIILYFLTFFLINAEVGNFHPAKYFHQFQNSNFQNLNYAILTIIILLLIVYFFITKKYLIIVLVFMSIDSSNKINSDLKFKQKESNEVYNFVYKYNNKFHNKVTIYLDSNYYKSTPLYKFRYLENASQFLYSFHKSTYKLNFIYSNNLHYKNVNFNNNLNNYLKSIK